MDDGLLDDIRPMVWSAQVIAPAQSADVTVLMRVTYRTLEEICGALFEPSGADRPEARPS